MHTKFKPAWWLPGPHLQTLWSTLARRRFRIAVRSERLGLPDGDFLDLCWVGEGEGPIVLVLHGLGGCVKSPYIQGILQAIQAKGWRGVLMHFRGCSGEPNRLQRTYHSGETDDLQFLIKVLQRREPNTPLAAVGYSLGGNALVKWSGETGADNPLCALVAISVPFELIKAVNRMQQGFSCFYQWWLLRCLRKTLAAKRKKMPLPLNKQEINALRTFWEFDEKITAPWHGFANALDYYQRASSRQYLRHIQVPTLLLQAKDDPFTTPDAIPASHELSSHVILEVSEMGGHVGFIAGKLPGRAVYWLEERVIDYLQKYLK